MTTVLVTGAQGLVGRYLVHELLTREYDVVGLGRAYRDDEYFRHDVTVGGELVRAPVPEMVRVGDFDRYRYRSVDLVDVQAVRIALRDFGPTIVVHLAAALRDAHPVQLAACNLTATASLMQAIVDRGPPWPRVILGSSGGVYGVQESVPIPEHAVCDPQQPYAITKMAAEELARSIARRCGISLSVARIFNVVGPGQEERHVVGAVAQQLLAMETAKTPSVLHVGPLSPTRDFVDVRDVASGLCDLVEDDATGVFNLGSGTETRVGELIATMVELSGLEDVDVCPSEDVPTGVTRHAADIAKLRMLGFAPRYSLAESLRDTLHYYRATADQIGSAMVNVGLTDGPREVQATSAHVDEAHHYDVTISSGLMKSLPSRLFRAFGRAKMAILTDENVDPLYATDLLDDLRSSGIDAFKVVVPPGESSKNAAQAGRVIRALWENGLDRRGLLLNVGGGVVTDLGGYVASTYLRGIDYVNIPTTLLAQHDASVGGKVGVNTDWAKNFVGAFHHPRAVYCDPAVLRTLDVANMRAGVAEAIKVAICGDAELFSLLEGSARTLVENRDVRALARVLRRAIATKLRLLSHDPLERDLKRPLNLGHTFGHPLEVAYGYRGVLHGEAVAFGTVVATQIALHRGACSAEAARRIIALLEEYSLPPTLKNARIEAAFHHLQAVRLTRARKLHFVLPTSPHSVMTIPELEDGELRSALDAIRRHSTLGRRIEGT